jgi:hypothetical protein
MQFSKPALQQLGSLLLAPPCEVLEATYVLPVAPSMQTSQRSTPSASFRGWVCGSDLQAGWTWAWC